MCHSVQLAGQIGRTAREQVPFDPKKRSALFREFVEYQSALGPEKATMNLDSSQREALFREFAQYQKQRHVIIAYRMAEDH